MAMLVWVCMMLIISDLPRLMPEVPVAPKPWMEQGNRHARRRDRKLRNTSW